MAKSQQTFNKKEKEKKRLRKREEKKKKKEERKNSSTGGELENMMAYVDSNGNILDSPPEEVETDTSEEVIQIATPKKLPEDKRKKGRLVYFNEEKGYGFIENLERSEKVFVHHSEFEEEVNLRDLVTYEIEKGDRGARAVQVKKA